MLSILLNGVIYTGVSLIIKQEIKSISGVDKYCISIYNIDQIVHYTPYDDQASSDTAFDAIIAAFNANGTFVDFDTIFNS